MSPGERRRARRLRTVARCALLLLLVALGLEVALRLREAHVATNGRSDLAASTRLLVLGDSNAYGGDETYPRIFERRWNADAGRGPVEVVNLGFPGVNTSLLANDFPRLLATFRPDTVTYMVGTNDYWTWLHAREAVPPWVRAESWLWQHSAIHRLLERGLRRVLPAPVLEIEPDIDQGWGFGRGVFRYGAERFYVDYRLRADPAYDEAQGHAELREIVDAARRARVRFVLVTYPTEDHFYGLANRRMRAVAAETGAQIVDLAALFAARCPTDRCASLFKPDKHLTPEGHEVVAEMLVDALAAPRAPGVAPAETR